MKDETKGWKKAFLRFEIKEENFARKAISCKTGENKWTNELTEKNGMKSRVWWVFWLIWILAIAS